MVLVGGLFAGGGLGEGVLLHDADDDEELDADELEGDARVLGGLVRERGLPEDEEPPAGGNGGGVWVQTNGRWGSEMDGSLNLNLRSSTHHSASRLEPSSSSRSSCQGNASRPRLALKERTIPTTEMMGTATMNWRVRASTRRRMLASNSAGVVFGGDGCQIRGALRREGRKRLPAYARTGVGEAGQAAAERRRPQVLGPLAFPRPPDARHGLGASACSLYSFWIFVIELGPVHEIFLFLFFLFCGVCSALNEQKWNCFERTHQGVRR